MSGEVGRRERKKAETRRALSGAAARLFLERGFDGVTVAEVFARLRLGWPLGRESGAR